MQHVLHAALMRVLQRSPLSWHAQVLNCSLFAIAYYTCIQAQQQARLSRQPSLKVLGTLHAAP